ncbi:hypothetical protein FV219_13170, partial [Methylobacterium sp. WL122]
MLAHVTIRTRLIGAVLVLFALTAGLGGFCFSRIHALSAVTDDLGGNALPSTRTLGRLATNFETLRSRQLAYLLSSEERRPQSLPRLRASMADIESDIAAYAGLVSDGEGALWDAVKATVPAYSAMGEEFIRRLDAADTKGATAYVLDGMLPALNAARAALKANLAFNEAAGKTSAAVAQALGE